MAPTVIQRSSSSKVRSRCVMAYGSSKTRTAVSKRTSCLRRFSRFLFSSHSKRMAGSQQKHCTQLDCRCQYICTYNLRHAFCGRLRCVAPDANVQRAMRHSQPGDETSLSAEAHSSGSRAPRTSECLRQGRRRSVEEKQRIVGIIFVEVELASVDFPTHIRIEPARSSSDFSQ